MSEHIAYSRAGAVAHLVINRPDKRNALTAEKVAALLAGVRRAGADDDVKVIVVRAEARRSAPASTSPTPATSTVRRTSRPGPGSVRSGRRPSGCASSCSPANRSSPRCTVPAWGSSVTWGW